MFAILADVGVIQVVLDHSIQFRLGFSERISLSGKPELKAERLPLAVFAFRKTTDHHFDGRYGFSFHVTDSVNISIT